MILLLGGPLGDRIEQEIMNPDVDTCIRREYGTPVNWDALPAGSLIIAAGWWDIIPKAIVESCRCYGIHWSLLPKYRGWSPLNWAIINGEPETGVSIFRMTPKVDDGPLLARGRVVIEPRDDARVLAEELIIISVELLKLYLPELRAGTEQLTPQTGEPSYFPRRTPEDGELDLSWPVERIRNMVRALVLPYPGAFVRLPDGSKLMVNEVRNPNAQDTLQETSKI